MKGLFWNKLTSLLKRNRDRQFFNISPKAFDTIDFSILIKKK